MTFPKMANPSPNLPILTILTLLHLGIVSGELNPWPAALPRHIQSLEMATRLHNDVASIEKASTDYGNIHHQTPSALLYPSSVDDVIDIIKLSNNCSVPFAVSVRGHGHSAAGQAMARGGVVVDMSSLGENGAGVRVSWEPELGYYADVGGEQLWADVLRATAAEHGLAPLSWTDYLYLTVGGTLSNGGISGQAFLNGPQIANVLEMDVVTGKGELITCSHHMNSELFFAVLGGLGQFGIIVRARIILDKAPTRAKWVRMMYTDFWSFTRDQEYLISMNTNGANYVEGSLLTDKSPPNNWRSNSFYSSSNQSKIATLLKQNHGLLYSIEFVKYYDDLTAHTIDEEIETIVQNMNFVHGFIFKKDVPLMDFLFRVGNLDNHRVQAHPWLNLFVPKSRVVDFNTGVLVNIIGRHNQTTGPILFYPLYRKKWDDRMSSVTPDEDIFYTLGLLHSCGPHETGYFLDQNKEIIKYCEEAGIEIKQYLPHYETRRDWMKHFGRKWKTFEERKMEFDPRMILSRGQNIFNSVLYSDI